MRAKEALILFLVKLLGRLSLKNLYRLARFIYFLLKPLPLQFKRTIYINTSRCLPHYPKQDLQRLVKENSFQTIFRMLEMIFFWFAPKQNIAKLIWETEGEDQFKAAVQQGHGMIILAPHLGSWEAVNYYIGLNYGGASLYKPRKSDFQELLVKMARERFGIQMFPTTIGGIKNLFQALHEGKCAGVLSDHDPGDNGGVFVPYFGISANTTTLIAKLSHKTQAPIFFVIAERLDKARGFRLHFVPGNAHIGAKDLRQAVTALNEQTAALVKLFPAQYEWSYKRFRRTRWGKVWFYETTARTPEFAQAIGLIGGIATGKSVAAHFFQDKGIEVIDTDAIARKLTHKGSAILEKMVAHFGVEILDASGELNRQHLRALIFQNHQARHWLEALLHPLIRQAAELEALNTQSPYCLVAIPLLKRREDYPFLKKIIYIATPREAQIKRLMARDHIDIDSATRIIDAQPSDAEFRKIADIVIENKGTEAELNAQLNELHRQLLLAQ